MASSTAGDEVNDENERPPEASEAAPHMPLEWRMLDNNLQFLGGCLEAATSALDFDVDPDKVTMHYNSNVPLHAPV
jgi:hypothetical protein